MNTIESSSFSAAKEGPTDLIAKLRSKDAAGLTIGDNIKPSYGIDDPRGLLLSFVFAPVYLYATFKGKHGFWDQTLSALPDSTFDGPSLDMGCGRGLVLMKVAARKRKLHQGGAGIIRPEDCLTYGIDIFNSGDQTGNSPEALYANAKALDLVAGVVAHRASFTDPLPFPDDCFSLITASLSLHNVPLTGRKTAIREACRVCRPGGTILVLDLLGYVEDYETEMKSQGWTDVKRKFAGLGVVFGSWPTQILRATKPNI